jgi:hypothetical protein
LVLSVQTSEAFRRAEAAEGITPYFSMSIRLLQKKAALSRIWNTACFTKVTCDGLNRARIPQVPEEQDNDGKNECKAGSENHDSDRRNDRHIPGSERSTGAFC